MTSLLSTSSLFRLVAILFVIMAYRASTLRGLAVAQMVFGALMIVFGVASIFAVHSWSSYVAFGIWIGIWVLIAGILGYIGAKDDSAPNKCLIGCFMGFSITACVMAGVMFICYCIAVAEFARILRCRSKYYGYDLHPTYDPRYYSYYYCYSNSKREMAANGAGLGSCLLIFSMVEFFLALASSIYCCTAVCCSTPSVGTTVTNQQVMYIQPQHMYPGVQGGMVIVQPSGAAVTTMQQGYQVPGQQQVYIPQQPVPMQQPAYWAVPSGSNPAGMPTVSYAGASGTQVQDPEKPPPYSYMQTGNAPPLASSSGSTPSEALAVDV